MTNFSKEAQAARKVDIGKARIGLSKIGRGAMGLRMSNKERLKLAKEGTKNLIEVTQEVNRLKRAQSTDSNQ